MSIGEEAADDGALPVVDVADDHDIHPLLRLSGSLGSARWCERG
jgi:hypothetical protein